MALLLPMLLAPVAVALVARMIFNPTMGPLNQFLSMFGLSNLPFLTNGHWALACIIAVEIWQWTPFVILMMLAGLQTLPEDVYEAAELENASAWQQFWGITFPMMLPISAAVVFIRLIESYKIMDTVFVMTGGGPGVDTETLTLFAYQEGFKKFNLGYTSALSFLFLIAITIIGVTYLALLRRIWRSVDERAGPYRTVELEPPPCRGRCLRVVSDHGVSALLGGGDGVQDPAGRGRRPDLYSVRRFHADPAALH